MHLKQNKLQKFEEFHACFTLVVQIDPGPMPTLTASAPAFFKSNAASDVAIFLL